ncbi:iron dicitrate transport regulator FecR [Pseudomonas sp. SDI]|uniref:FecR family protein n=1 Tax=Pseudomonas sp. SDI TaxID=2170734 RepID=UPI000DE771CB|nr:FecR family protein [Pseudomonas sp. SDI]PWB32415.1 iron dicitrate transport regulator FecR [Pseudomonas sp. SDI]
MTFTALDHATHEAVDWLLKLEGQAPGSPTRQAFERWLGSNPAHARAWTQVNGLLGAPLADLHEAEQRHPGQLAAASRALRGLPSPSRRKVLGGGLAMVLLGLGGAGIAQRVTPLGGLLADLHTATGERRSVILSDGSRLHLNARSAVDLRFDGRSRRILLRDGELQVDVVADPARPFIVETHDGRVQALGTRFSVSQQSAASCVAVQQHSVLLTTNSGRSQQVDSGQAFRFDSQHIAALAPSMRTRAAWRDGRIDVRDEPLGELVEALRPYRAGLLRISPQAAQVRVYGSFLLDDSARTLQSLAETLPIRVERFGPWLTRIDLK